MSATVIVTSIVFSFLFSQPDYSRSANSGQPNALYNPDAPMHSATKFTINCGLFATRIVQIMNNIVPRKNARML
jgi:hypothetical protein